MKTLGDILLLALAVVVMVVVAVGVTAFCWRLSEWQP